mgnify:FL=1|jgi:hypothetical protein|tara:strand:- start:255 stop:827 length:573 start_codon:yes stop_codon:yes gene_type:complete
MNENVLKREFGKKDVTRLRNLMTGKHNNKSGQSVGYRKKETFHKEGDVWEEDGRKWTIKDGIKQNVTKMDRAKKAYLKPLLCPKCNNVMNKGADPGYYNHFGHCFKCFKKFETYMIANGLWDDFVKKTKNGNIDTFIKWYKDFVNESLNQTNAGFVTEAGDVESWHGGFDRAKVMEALDETVKIWEEAKD